MGGSGELPVGRAVFLLFLAALMVQLLCCASWCAAGVQDVWRWGAAGVCITASLLQLPLLAKVAWSGQEDGCWSMLHPGLPAFSKHVCLAPSTRPRRSPTTISATAQLRACEAFGN